MSLAADTSVLTVRDLCRPDLDSLLSAWGLTIRYLPDAADIPGSFWGAPEAGIAGLDVFVRNDTPLHSLLHEACHVICMAPELRARHKGDAGSSDIEEAAVCYLQILLAGQLPKIGSARLMADMDSWGYSFRLGSTGRWFAEDAEDARAWLLAHSLLDTCGRPTFALRTVS